MIASKQLPSSIVFEDEAVVIFNDIHPKAPTHVLIVPKTHVESILALDEATKDLPGLLILKAKQFAKEKGLRGYQLRFHVGREGGQIIDHLHLHLMSEQTI